MEKILDHRLCKDANDGYEYLVRWRGYTSDDDSWISEDKFDGLLLIKKYWKTKQKLKKKKKKKKSKSSSKGEI